MPANKDNQISFKVDEEYRARVKAAADNEDISVANFSRKLHRTAFILYERYGLEGMREFIKELPASPGKSSKRGQGHAHG